MYDCNYTDSVWIKSPSHRDDVGVTCYMHRKITVILWSHKNHATEHQVLKKLSPRWGLMLLRSLIMEWRKLWWALLQRSHKWQSQEQFQRNNDQTRRLPWNELNNERKWKNGVKVSSWINVDKKERIEDIYGVKWIKQRICCSSKSCLSLICLLLYISIYILHKQSIQDMESAIPYWTLLSFLFSIFLAVDSWDQSAPDQNSGWWTFRDLAQLCKRFHVIQMILTLDCFTEL